LETYRRTETRKERKDSRNSPKITPAEEKTDSPLASLKHLPYVPRYADRVCDFPEADSRKKANRHSYHSGVESFSTSLPAINFPDPFSPQRRMKTQFDGGNMVSRSRSLKVHTRDLQYSENQAKRISLALLEGRPNDDRAIPSKGRPSSTYVDPIAGSGHLPSSQMWTSALHDALTSLPEPQRPRLQANDRHNWEQASQAGSDAGDFLHLKSIRRKHAKAGDADVNSPKLERIESAVPNAAVQTQTVRATRVKSKEESKPTAAVDKNAKSTKRSGLFSIFRRMVKSR